MINLKKSIMLFLIISVLCTQMVNSLIEANFLYENEEGDSLSNVIIVGYVCLDSDCSTVDPLWKINTWQETPYEQPLNTLNHNPSLPNGITLYFPNSPLYNADYGYMWRYFAEEYRSKVQPPWAMPEGDYIIQPNPTIRVFEKTDNCKAEFTPAIQSCAEAGLPLSILTDTELSAETKSAYIPSNDYYYPKDDPLLRQWRELETKMQVDVKPQGSSSSVSGFPTSDTFDIYADETHDFSFLWETSVDTTPGTYTVTMESSVPDAKCDQGNMGSVTKTFDVYIAKTLDGCKAELNNFIVDVTDINQPIDVKGTHLNTYQKKLLPPIFC